MKKLYLSVCLAVFLAVDLVWQQQTLATFRVQLQQPQKVGCDLLAVLFRPVEAKLPPTLRGFDTGVLEVRDLSVKVDQDNSLDLSKCEVRVKTTKCRSDEKVSRKKSETREDGTLVWKSDDTSLTRIPVRMRYGTALLISFKETSAASTVKRAGRKALGHMDIAARSMLQSAMCKCRLVASLSCASRF